VLAQIPVGEQAATDYVNNELGGVDGRPIKLIKCDGKADPAATTACANSAARSGAAAEVGLSTLLGQNSFKALVNAGIPVLADPTSPEMTTSTHVFSFGGGSVTEYPGQIAFAAEQGAKSVVMVGLDDPSFHSGVQFAQETANRLGVKVTPVYVPAAQTDFTPIVAKALALKPDFISVSESGAAGVTFRKALTQQGWPAEKTIQDGGATDKKAFFGSVDPKLVQNTYFSYEFTNYDDTSDPQVQTFREALKKYAPSAGLSEFYEWGFANVMTIADIARRVGAESFDAAALTRFLTNVEGYKVYVGGTLSRRDAPRQFPAIIQQNVQVLQYRDGRLWTAKDFFNPLTFTLNR